MKDIVELLREEQRRLIDQAQPFLDQAERLAEAIVALHYRPLQVEKAFKSKGTRDGSPVNAPKGERSKAIHDAVAEFLGNNGATTEEITRHLKSIGVLKRRAGKTVVGGYLLYKNRFTFGSDGQWRVTK